MSSDSDDDVLGNLPGTDRPSAGRGGGRGVGGRVLRNFVAESNLSSSSDDDGIVLPGTGGRGSGSGGSNKRALPSMGGGGGAKAPGPKTAAKKSSPVGGAGPTRAAPNPSPKKSAASPQQGPKVIAVVTPIHPYAAGAQNQISLEMEDIINVFEKDASGWWVGRNKTTGAVGLFPSTYVEDAQEAGGPSSGQTKPAAAPASDSGDDNDDDDDDGSASFEDVGTADRTAERTPKQAPLNAPKNFGKSSEAPAARAATKSESPGQALNITPTSNTTASPSQPQQGKRASVAAEEEDDTSDVSLNLDESTTMSPEQSRRAESLGSSLAANTPNPGAPASATKATTQERQLAQAASSSPPPSASNGKNTESSTVDGEKTRSFRSQVGKTTIDSSPRQTVSDIKKRFSDDDTTSDISIPASRGPKTSANANTSAQAAATTQPKKEEIAPAAVTPAAAPQQKEQQAQPKPAALHDDTSAVTREEEEKATVPQAKEHREQPAAASIGGGEDELDRDPELDNILPPNNSSSGAGGRPPHVEGGQIKNPYYYNNYEASHQQGASGAAIRSATPDRNRMYGSSPSPSDPGSRTQQPLSAAPSPNNRPPMSQQQQVTAPPGVNAVADRGRRELLMRAHERLNRRDSGSGHLEGGGHRAPSPGLSSMIDPQQRMTSGAADQAARDRLARENARLTEELNFLQKDNQRLRQGMTEANSSEAQRLRSQLEESEATRKDHELTIARLKLQFEAQLKDASDHERALKDELRAYSTTLEQFETVCADKDQQLNQERATTTKLKQDLKEKEAECIRSGDEAARIREDSKVRLERTNELLEDAKKQRTHLIELNDKFGRDKDAAVAEKKRLSEELKAIQLELARQQERAADDAAASRRECDRYKALVQEKERVLGMRIADEQRAKEHYQAKVNEVEEQVTQIKSHQQEVLRTVQEEHRRQVSSVRDEIAHYQQRYREAQSEAESHQKRYEERMDIERKQLADEMNKTYATMEKDLQEARSFNNRDEEVITGLRQRVAELEVQVDQVETGMLAKDEKLAAQETELKTVTETLEHLLQSDDHVAKERDETVSELDKARVEIANMRDDVAMCRTLDDQLQDLSRECERLSDELSRVSKDRSSLWTENHRLEGEVAQWRSEAQELRAAMKGRGISARVSSGGAHDFTY